MGSIACSKAADQGVIVPAVHAIMSPGGDDYEQRTGVDETDRCAYRHVAVGGRTAAGCNLCQFGCRVQLGGSDEVWVPAMKAVHEKFKGERGTYAQFGDSITVSRAFWFGLKYAPKNASPEMTKALGLVKDYMLEDCWDWKGPEYGNEGQMTIRWAHQNVDKWLKELNPEVALMMFGTNDLGSLELPEYDTKTREVVQKCLDNGTILILSTIPPKHGQAEKAAVFADAVRRIAREMKVPLTDYHAEILRRRPDDWDGAADQFRQYQGYDVPTLISRDGVHPSNPQQYANDYSAEGLRMQRLRTPQLPRVAEVRRGDREGVAEEAGSARTLPGGPLFFQDFEGPGDWDGTVTDKDTPAANKHVVEGHGDDQYFGRKIRVGIRKPPVAVAADTYLTFDYYVEGSDFLMVFLFDLDIMDNCRYPIDNPAIGKWTTHTMKVTGAQAAEEGPQGRRHLLLRRSAGQQNTRLMVDNVRLEGSGD